MERNGVLTTRDTASAFLWRHGRILLLRRDVTMRSYPGRWSVVSGSVERGERPLDTAWREVGEETGYPREVLRPVAAGAPLTVDEVERRVRWRVHPFLFLLHDDGEPRLNRENADFTWLCAEELAGMSTVPRLAQALDELLPEAQPAALELVHRLREDTVHGAHAIAAEMLGGLHGLLPALKNWPEVLRAAQLLADARGAMAPPAAALSRWLGKMGPSEGVKGPHPWAAPLGHVEHAVLTERLREVERALALAGQATARAGTACLLGKGTVASFSFSETVLQAFRLACQEASPPRRVLLGRSLPGGEGEALGRALGELGYEVEVLEDERLVGRIGEAQLLLVGADTVFSDGAVANKVGTLALARAARSARVKVVVLADSFKRQLPGRGFLPEHSPETGSALFEVVPPAWIDEIVDEDTLA